MITDPTIAFDSIPNIMLMNGKPPFGHPGGKTSESFTVTQGNHAAAVKVHLIYNVKL